jgi:hypothetical protein
MAKTSRMRQASGRRVRRVALRPVLLLWALIAIPLGWLLTVPAEAVPQQSGGGHTATVGDASEGWYASTPIDLCSTPLGCPPEQVPTSPYPADTLHVGIAGGRETARTYVLPNLLSLPVGATPTGGTMTVPVDTAGTDGTTSADTATMLACAVTQPFTDGAAGSSAPAPATNCKTSVPAKYDAKKATFTVDLTPFLKGWAAGQPALGIALVPDPDEMSPTENWHVTIYGRKFAGHDHVQSSITFTPPPPIASTGAASHDTAPPPAPAPAAGTPGVGTPDIPSATSSSNEPPPVVAPDEQAPVAQQPVAFTKEFQYPLAFLAPIALLIGAVFFTRLFTRDPLPRRVGVR